MAVWLSQLAVSGRCQLFERIAERTWKHVIRNHSVHVHTDENGLTNDLIAEIRVNARSNTNIGVWSNRAFKEEQHGNDLDVFVESQPGEFVWYALQAKVLSRHGTYESLAKDHGGEYQWEKLARLSAMAGCITKYLLYNGVANYRYSGPDKWGRTFTEEQFGCSLVDPDLIATLAQAGPVRFLSVHHQHAQPWRILTCGPQPLSGVTLFNAAQIRRAVRYYPESFGTTDLPPALDQATKLNGLSENAIEALSREVQRTPECRLVVRSTRSLNSSARRER